MTEFIGFLAAILTTACYIPQAVHVLRTRNTGGISLLAYSTLFLGIALWIIYGIFISSMPIMLANAITLPLVGTVIVLKLKHK